MSAEIDFSINLTTLWDMLEEHDWGYWDSKDPEVYRDGAEWWEMIEKHADTFEKKRLVKDFEKHHNSGPEFNTERYPKPERPEE